MVSKGKVEMCKKNIKATWMSIYFRYMITKQRTLTQVHSYCISVTLIILQVGFDGNRRTCAARTRLFRLNNRKTKRCAPSPANRSFAAPLFILFLPSIQLPPGQINDIKRKSAINPSLGKNPINKA
jgi:hypothetical protein